MKWNKKKDILYLAVGHGTMTNGKWDCGTAYGGYTEAGLMLPIVKEAVKLLRKSGVKVITDADKKNNKNMTATVSEANKNGVTLYASVHCDWYKASSGIMFYYGSGKGKAFGDAICKYIAKTLKIRNKGGTKDLAKYEVKGPDAPSIILETGSIKNDISKLKQAKKYGRTIAKAICKYIGVEVYVTMRTKLKRMFADTLAYMNAHHFAYDSHGGGNSWAKAKKSKKSNCASAVSYACQRLGLLKAGQQFYINGTTVHCQGKGSTKAVKKAFTIRHPKKSPKGAKVKSGYICGYENNAHTQMFAKYNTSKIPMWYSWGRADKGKKQPHRKKSYDKKRIMTVMIPKG